MSSTKPTLPFDPFAIARATSEAAMGLAMRPQDLLEVQVAAAKQWGDFWSGALGGKSGEKPRDRRFHSAQWQDDPYYRSVRDAICSPPSNCATWLRSATATAARKR